MSRSRFLVLAVVFLAAFPWFGQPGVGGPGKPAVSSPARPAAALPAPAPGDDVGKPEASLPPGTDPGWWATVQKDIQQQEYSVTWSDQTPIAGSKGAWQAPNRAQGFRTYFTERGIRLVPRSEEAPAWEWGLELARWGRDGALQDVAPAKPHAESNRVTLDRQGIQEWYINDERGLEQGFSIPSAPESKLSAVSSQLPADGSVSSTQSSVLSPQSYLFLDLALSGTLRPVISEDGQAVDFYGDVNFNVLHYAALKVTDATGRVLPAHFEGWSGSPFPNSEFRIPNSSGGIRIVADDTGASYPITVDPLATSPAWTAESNQDNARFGYSVGTAGDVNGDGYSDVIIGAYAYDNGESNEGRAFVYLGSASGLGTTPWTAESNQASASFGRCVATAGDVNGDGYSDVIIGAPEYDNGETDEGRAFVYLGSASGLGTTPWTAESDQASALFGVTVATAGDVDGDGYSDVIVGAPSYSIGGGTFVYVGGPSGLAITPAWTVLSGQSGEYFGCSVGTAGDVDGDGYSDVIVGSKDVDIGQTDEGRAYVYEGSASGLPPSPAWIAESNQTNAHFGTSVGTAGDVNGDGYSDVIIGAPEYDNGETDEGAVFVWLGSSTGLGANGTPLNADWTAESNMPGALFGCSVATAGDVNGNGYSDVIVGASLYDNGQTDEGAAYVYLGSASGLETTPWTAESDQASAFFGLSVATAGDMNGDGYSDVIVGAQDYDNGQTDEGRAYVYFGSASGPAATAAWTGSGDQDSACFGWSVATAGDVDGDGYSDIIVGAAYHHGGGENRGRAYAYLGSASGLATTAAWTGSGDQDSAHFGSSVATAGDVDGDGYSDIIVGAAYHHGGGENRGRAYVYLGSASGLATTAGWTGSGDQDSAVFGYSVATAGDVNGDGYSDIIVGAYGHDAGGAAGADRGRAYVYLGSASGPATTAAWTGSGDQGIALFGHSVATAGDVNGGRLLGHHRRRLLP